VLRAWLCYRKVWLELEDGRQLGFPAASYGCLANASDELLAKVRLEPRGRALRWEELDQDLSIDGILAGRWRS
jgi:hypothetical protein